MGEMICVHLGACGNNVGEAFYNALSQEHCIGPDGRFYGKDYFYLEGIQMFYGKCYNQVYARAVCADLNQTDIQNLRYTPYGCLFKPQNMISTNGSGTANIWAKGYRTDGCAILNPVLEAIRHEAETLDSIHGFQIIHSLGGGTGSGFGSLLFENLVDEYPNNIISTVSIFPSSLSDDIVVEPYNLILSLPNLISCTHLNYCVHNETIADICKIKLCLGPTMSFRDINFIIAQTIAGYSACVRFPSQLSGGIRKLYTNLVPFPQMHCIVPGFAPIINKNQLKYENNNTFQLVKNILTDYHCLVTSSLKCGKILSLAAMFRGCISPKQVDECLNYLVYTNPQNFVSWNPGHITTTICKVTPKEMPISVSIAANTSNILDLLCEMMCRYEVMFKKTAFLHWYLNEGMELDEFTNAQDNILQWLKDYMEVMKDNFTQTPSPTEGQDLCRCNLDNTDSTTSRNSSKSTQSDSLVHGRTSNSTQTDNLGHRRPSNSTQTDSLGHRRTSNWTQTDNLGHRRISNSTQGDSLEHRRTSTSTQGDNLGHRRTSNIIQGDTLGNRTISYNTHTDSVGRRATSNSIQADCVERPSTSYCTEADCVRRRATSNSTQADCVERPSTSYCTQANCVGRRAISNTSIKTNTRMRNNRSNKVNHPLQSSVKQHKQKKVLNNIKKCHK